MENKKDIWIKFSDEHPKEYGNYWIYRNAPKPHPRVVERDYIRDRGWSCGIMDFSNWTHWMPIKKPKPPKK